MSICINIINIIALATIIYFLTYAITINILKDKIKQTRVYNKFSECIFLSIKRKLIPNRLMVITPLVVFLIMVLLGLISFAIFNSYLKIISTAFILSLPFFISPILIIKILLNKERTNIIKILPMYVVNIKNHMAEDNNIISAIQRTNVEEPLKKYIITFKTNISRGMSAIAAFDLLKQEVNVKVFTDFINSCQVCYLNGGDFNRVLEQFIDIITKENIHKESSKEKAYADILTLIIMIVLNILVIVMFVFANKEYANIIRETFFGRLVLNFNAISYIFIAYLISRIYKEE